MPRCSDCNKFVGLDAENDPEVNGLQIDRDGDIEAEVRIENNCLECGTVLRSATFSLDVKAPEEALEHVRAHTEPDAMDNELEVDAEFSRTERYVGKGRGAKHFYGVEGNVLVTCSCGKLDAISVPWSDEIQASYMDEEG